MSQAWEVPEILARAIGQGTEYEEMIDAYIVKPNFYCVGGSVTFDAAISWLLLRNVPLIRFQSSLAAFKSGM